MIKGLRLLNARWLLCWVNGSYRSNLQTHVRAGIIGHLNVVLGSLIFINNVVKAGAVFIKRLCAALLNVLHLVVCAFNSVTDHGTANQANHGGQSPAVAIADCIANSTTRNSAQNGSAAGFGRFGNDGLVIAHLTRHSHLLHGGGAGNDTGQNIGCCCIEGEQTRNSCD